VLHKKQRPKKQDDDSEVTEQERYDFVEEMLRADAELRAASDYDALGYTQRGPKSAVRAEDAERATTEPTEQTHPQRATEGRVAAEGAPESDAPIAGSSLMASEQGNGPDNHTDVKAPRGRKRPRPVGMIKPRLQTDQENIGSPTIQSQGEAEERPVRGGVAPVDEGPGNSESQERPIATQQSAGAIKTSDGSATFSQPNPPVGPGTVTITFKARAQGRWETIHELTVDPSEPSHVEQVAKADARNRQATFYDKYLRIITPAQCFDAAIEDGTNTVFVTLHGEAIVDESSDDDTDRDRKAKRRRK
jgi:hypothetical protein